MKEATGELNNTVIVVIAVGILIAFFYYTLWPMIRGNFESKTACAKAVCDPCENKKNDCQTVTCHAKDDKSKTFECVYRG